MISFDNLVQSIGRRDLVLPHFESALMSGRWPESYTVTIDSGPYYGAGDGYFHPSTHPLLPARQLYYMFHPDTRDKMVRERRTTQLEWVLAQGTALHSIFQAQLQMCGLCQPEDTEVEYVIHDHHVRGRIDMMINHPTEGRILGELKTRTSYLYVRQEGPEPSWVAQVNLGLDAMDCDLGVLIMVEAGMPFRMREFHIQRDRELLDAIYAKFDLVRQSISDNAPPEPSCEDKSKCCARDVCMCYSKLCDQ